VPILSIALLLAVLSGQATAPHAPNANAWPLAVTHEASTSLERLPPAQRSTLLPLLKPYLGPLVQGESPEEINQMMRSFRVERLTLAGSPAVAVQPSGRDLCGASGNCSFWIIDLRHRRVVLNAVGIRSFAVNSSRPGVMPDIITESHASAYEQEHIRWHFQGSSYERGECATVASADSDGQPYPTPKITLHPCDPEGN
jgi:hypothetical protein